jgi:uncharacterized protein (DUF2235 family)
MPKKLLPRKKNILIFSDGTGQAGGISVDERRSNIYKLYRAARVGPDSIIKPAEQVAYYDAGLGSLPPSGGTIKALFRMAHNFLSEATGFGLTTNIIDCYESIIRLWRPGDRIFLFGFSRGAYTVRCVSGVLAQCGVPTRLENGAPMKYDGGTARRLAKIAVRKVYQHTASVPLANATPRQKELMDQRSELAHQFRENYASRQDDKSDFPFFIGVFDTVASIASKGSLIILVLAVLAVAAVFAAGFWFAQPVAEMVFGSTIGSFFAGLAELIHFDTASWWHSFFAVLSGFVLTTFIWYVTQQVKFAPTANPKKWWRTLNISFRRMAFEDKTLNDNVRYARHAISIDENRAAFQRVGWGAASANRPDKDEQGIDTFQQYWFAGNHSDIGGSYFENESRLSDISMGWMIEAAKKIKGGIKIDKSVLQLYPSPGGMQHDQRKEGFPLLTKWLRLTWPGKRRKIPDTKAPLDDSVYARFKLPAVIQYDVAAPYRPETLRTHERLTQYYKDIPEPKPENKLVAYIKSFFLTTEPLHLYTVKLTPSGGRRV